MSAPALSDFSELPVQGLSQYECIYADPSSGLAIGFLPRTKRRNFRSAHFIGEWDEKNKCMKDIPSERVVELRDELGVKRHTHECVYDLILKHPNSLLASNYCDYQNDDVEDIRDIADDLYYLICYAEYGEKSYDMIYLFAYCLNNDRLIELSYFIKHTHIPITDYVCYMFAIKFPSYDLWKKLYPVLGVKPIKIYETYGLYYIHTSFCQSLVSDVGIDKVSEWLEEGERDGLHYCRAIRTYVYECLEDRSFKSAQHGGLICPTTTDSDDEPSDDN